MTHTEFIELNAAKLSHEFPGILLSGCNGSGKTFLAKEIAIKAAREANIWAFLLRYKDGRPVTSALAPNDTTWKSLRDRATSSRDSELLSRMSLALDRGLWEELSELAVSQTTVLLVLEVDTKTWSRSPQLREAISLWESNQRPLILICSRHFASLRLHPPRLSVERVPYPSRTEVQDIARQWLAKVVEPPALQRSIDAAIGLAGHHPGILTSLLRAFQAEFHLRSYPRPLSDRDSEAQEVMFTASHQQEVREAMQRIWDEMLTAERQCVLLLSSETISGHSIETTLRRVSIPDFDYRDLAYRREWLRRYARDIQNYFFITESSPQPHLTAALFSQFLGSKDSRGMPVDLFREKRVRTGMRLEFWTIVFSVAAWTVSTLYLGWVEVGTASLVLPILFLAIMRALSSGRNSIVGKLAGRSRDK